MPFKLFSYIVVLVFLVTFIGLNLGNTSDINLWFSEKGQFQEVPIVISFLIMYILGALSIVPYIIGNQFRLRRKRKDKKSIPSTTPVKISKKGSDEKNTFPQDSQDK